MSLKLILCCTLIGLMSPWLTLTAKAEVQNSFIAIMPKSYPPDVQVAGGRPAGFAIDSIRAVAERAGLKVRIKVVSNWGEVKESIKKKEAHVVASMGISESLTKWVSYTPPIETHNMAIFTRASFKEIKSVHDLENHSVGAVDTSVAIKILNAHEDINKVYFNSVQEALLTLIAGGVDAVIYPREVVESIARIAHIDQELNLAIPSLMEIKRAIAVRKDLPKLHERLSIATEEFIRSEDYKRIYDKWHGSPDPLFTHQELLWYLAATALVVIFIILGWKNYSISRLNTRLKQTIREQVEAEQQLKDNQEMLAESQAQAQVGSWELDLTTKKVKWSPELHRITGIPVEDFTGDYTEITRYFFKEDLSQPVPNNYEALFAAIKRKGPFTFKVKRPDGTIRVLSGIFKTDFDSQGNATRILGTIQDITEQRMAEKALRESEMRFRQLTESIQEGIWVCDQRGYIVLCNPAMAAMIGFNQVELMNCPASDFLFTEDLPIAEDIFQRSHRGLHEKFEFKIRHRSGAPVYVRMSTAPIVEDGEFKGIRAFVTDITQSLKREREKRRLESRLRQLQKMEAIGTLAGGIAHDMNNILQGMYLSITMAMDSLKANGHPAHEKLDVALRFGARGRDLVKQILAFSRKDEQQRVSLDLRETIMETLELMRATFPKNIKIEHHISVDAAPVVGDPSQLSQVVMNLCANAGYAMKDQGGTLSIHLKRVHLSPQETTVLGLKPGEYFKCSVKDTGHGIPEEIRDRIFDPFFTTKPIGDGTGMGLSVVHGIIDNHNGSIVLDSDSQKATSFAFYLAASKSVVNQRSKTSGSVEMNGHEHILIVEDEIELAQLIQGLLESYGYTVTISSNSLEALERFQAAPEELDLVVTDQNMPELTGIQLSEHLLVIKPELPIILCTGHSDHVTQERVRKVGITTYVMKPIDPKELISLIREALDQRQPAISANEPPANRTS